MTTILITGATRGLGLATAQAALATGARVLGTGRTPEALAGLSRRGAARRGSARRGSAHRGPEPVLLDLADLDGVRAAVSRLAQVDAVVCNAGLQLLRGVTWTVDGFEETFQVNHLAHLALVDALLARPVPPRRVVLVGSATHDPAVRTGTPDPVESDDLAGLARGGPGSEPDRTAGLRRYTTTKLLAVATAAALARERPDVHVSCFDPGLMPGTGLARQYPAAVRVLWSTAFRGLSVLPFASSPARSGRALATLLAEEPPPVPSGSYVDHRLRVVDPSARARDTGYQDSVLRQSRSLLSTSAERAAGEPPRSGGGSVGRP